MNAPTLAVILDHNGLPSWHTITALRALIAPGLGEGCPLHTVIARANDVVRLAAKSLREVDLYVAQLNLGRTVDDAPGPVVAFVQPSTARGDAVAAVFGTGGDNGVAAMLLRQAHCPPDVVERAFL